MAETLLNVLAEELLSRALSLAANSLSRLWGVKEDLEALAEKVKLIQSLLSEAEGKCTTELVQIWLKRLQATTFDANNLLDEFDYEVLRKKMEKQMKDKVRNFVSSSNPLAFRLKMASQIKKINLELLKVFEDARDIGLRPAEISNYPTDFGKGPRITDPFLAGLDIVGRDDEVKNVVNALTSLENKKDLSVIGIVGMAGQGKTTIAKLVYNNENVVKDFEKRIWVCVSENFVVEKLLNDMIENLKGIRPELTVRQAIVDKLKEELSGKRFLLVLDDVWNEEQELWDCMRTCLLEIGGLKGSKIIVTTRSDKVVTVMQGFCISLGKLSDEHSWMLFEKLAYAEGGAVKTEQLMNIGKRIVKRCGGLPLAIKAIAGLLYFERQEQKWLKFEENNKWGSSEAVRGVLSIIEISYDHLPSLSLKQCFVYCSLFPKDSVIEREELVQLWMAQGFLKSESQGDMEEVGVEYLNILWQRSLLQDVILNDYGSITSCKMHDVVHDFALKASKGYCLTTENEILNDDIKVVHLCVNLKRGKSLNASGVSFLRLQTLVLSGGIFGDVLLRLKCLRTLVVKSEDVKELPKSIGKLKHLRHLDIFDTSIRKLPNSVTKLYNLLTLRLNRLEQLPKSFKNLVKLRHLYVQGYYIRTPQCLLREIGQLTSLRTLSYFKVSQSKGCQIEELGNLQKLEGTLRIYDLENVGSFDEASKANLSKKANIESLKLHLNDDEVDDKDCNHKDVLEGLEPHPNLKSLTIEEYGGKNLPSWMMMVRSSVILRNLVEMNLTNLMWCEEIPPLGHLPFLKILVILNMESIKRIGQGFYGWTTANNPDPNGASSSSQSSISGGTSSSDVALFPSLQELRIFQMPNLEGWSDLSLHSSSSVRVFPHLKTLEILNCPNLARLPDTVLGNLFSLQKLDISRFFKLSSLPSNLGGLSCLEELDIPLNSAIWMESIGRPTKLKKLTLHLSEDLDYFTWPPKTETKYFVSLEYIRLNGTPKLKSLPDQIQYLPALSELSLRYFDGMEALPEWLGNIHSLQSLWLRDCKNLKYFPSAEAMKQGLTNLCELCIFGCPTLSEMCQKGSGLEWHKIAHIPEIRIDDDIIQSLS